MNMKKSVHQCQAWEDSTETLKPRWAVCLEGTSGPAARLLMIGLALLSVLLSLVRHPDTEMKDEMEIVTDAITLLLIEGEAKLLPVWLGFVWTEPMPRSD